MFADKLFVFLKYLVVYFVFILLSLINKSQNDLYFVFDLLPNFEIILIFLLFFWSSDRVILLKYNLFLFGIIIDTFNFLPLGLSSLSLLISYKIIYWLRNYFILENHFIYFFRDNTLFITVYFCLQWFIFSFYNTNFFPFQGVFINIVKNIIFSNLLYLIYKKLFRNV